MFTAKIIRKSIDHVAKALFVDIEYTDGIITTAEQLRFGFDVSLDDIKKTIKRQTNLLDGAQAKSDSIILGALDLSGVVLLPAMAASEQARSDWFRNFNRLQSVHRLIELQILTGNEPQVAALRLATQTDFRAAYIADM